MSQYNIIAEARIESALKKILGALTPRDKAVMRETIWLMERDLK